MNEYSQAAFEKILAEYNREHAWLLSLITDPEGKRYFVEKSAGERLREYQEQLARMADFLKFAGNPQEKFSSIHVAGTSGKGSVTVMLASMLQAAGIRTGHHTSPYLQVCNEKLVADGSMVSPSDFTETLIAFRQIYQAWIEHGGAYDALKYGEAWVGLTYLWLARQEVAWAVVETGLGGRYDPTNVLPAQAAVITNIDYDHVNSLGPSLREIAYHKAGIIKPGAVVVTGERKPDIVEVFQQEAAEKNAVLFRIGSEFNYYHEDHFSSGLLTVEAPFNTFKNIRLGMKGKFQPENAALSVALLDIMAERQMIEINPGDAVKELEHIRFPGRLEIIQQSPLVIMDGAHNPHKMQGLVDSMLDIYPGRKITVVFGMLSTKDAEGMLQQLSRLSPDWMLTQPHVFGKPSLQAEEIAETVGKKYIGTKVNVFENVSDAVEAAIGASGPDDIVLITGSLYLLGEARERWYPKDEILRALEYGPNPIS